MSTIKLSVVKKDFKIDKKNGRVICILTACIDNDKFRSVYLRPREFNYNNRKLDPCYNFTVRGVAICSKDDTFDENIGKKVSVNKARLEAYKVLKCMFNRWKHDLEVAKKDLKEAEGTLDKFIAREKSRLKELSVEETIVEQKENTEENGK